jgi:hypothetical protein
VLFYNPPRDEDIKISDKKEIIHLAPLHGNCSDKIFKKRWAQSRKFVKAIKCGVHFKCACGFKFKILD